ncbi:MAG: AbrB/MazE/SpoVT family DNA-binding domain-containing protein [Elusimicrobia bacterium]|nr:AbrB/MazE/SpoVT family DNA-binding domain-containing protein [Elusimicrobiota bacterium]
MIAKRTYKNQITLPKEIISLFGDIEYFDVQKRGDEIVLRPVEIKAKGEALAAIRGKVKKLGLTEKDIDAAIRWARQKEASS